MNKPQRGRAPIKNYPHHSTKDAVKKRKKGIKNIKQKNSAQNKPGFKDTSTKSSIFC